MGQGKNQWLVTLELHGIPARLMQSLYGLSFYVRTTIWPANLQPLYILDYPIDPFIARFIVPAVVVLIAIAALAFFWWRGRMSALVAAMAAYTVMLLPVLGLIQNGPQIVADRYSYLPCLALALLAGSLLMIAARHPQRWRGAIAAVALAGAVVALSTRTVAQISVWKSTESLWTHQYAMDPANRFGQNGYGYVLLQQKKYAEAIPLFRAVLERTPDNHKAHHNLWIALRESGNEAGLIAAWQQAQQIPSIARDAFYEHGDWLVGKQRAAEALPLLRRAVEIDPAHVKANTDMGFALMKLNRRDEAIAAYQRAIAADPNFFTARLNLALALRGAGRSSEAIEHLEAAIRINPQHERARQVLAELRAGRTAP